jgi:hypothetical protein
MAWFRLGQEQEGRSEAEVARCELELLDELAAEDRRRQRRGRRRLAHREQLRIDDR